MKLQSRYILTTLISAGLAFTATPRTFSHENEAGDDHERGGKVEGSESLEQEVKLTASADTPAGAKAEAELKATNVNGVASAILKLEVEGLAAGTYKVSVTSLADAAVTTALGSFEVVAGGSETEDENEDGEHHHSATTDPATRSAGSHEGENHDGDHHDGSDDDGESKVVFGGADGIAFPDGFNPLDIGGVTITDANDVVLFTGSFVTAATGTFSATVAVQAGSDAPAVTGQAVVKAKMRKKSLSQRFALAAHGLPAGTPVTVTFNGAQTLKARTTSKGNLGVTRLPRGVAGHHLTSVEISGPNGEHLGQAHF